MKSICNSSSASLIQIKYYEIRRIDAGIIILISFPLIYGLNLFRSVHTVTPLWCAAVAGKYRVVDVLVR